ncbi:membrane protein insertase YidC [Staphylococcus chromogenes]|nr:membrane protein insertase YidC [Staphylococcus chromogenes]
MIDFLMYPVSAVLKFWHWFFHSGLGWSSSTAWILSIFALVVTVRTIIAPLSWMMMKSGRIAQRIRPELHRIQEEYNKRVDPEAAKWKQEETKRIQKEAGYNMWAGCLPVFIQLPVFIGLYQLLLQIARPAEGFNSPHHGLGFMTSADIDDFLAARIGNVPLPAYLSMKSEELAELGVTRAALMELALPVLIAASLFTAINMFYSSYRNYKTLDWSSSVAVFIARALLFIDCWVPFTLISSAFAAPVPVAILFYWFGGNLWTMSQYIIMMLILNKKYPFDDSFEELRLSKKAEFKEKEKEKKAHKRFIRRKRLAMVFQPHRAKTHYAEVKAVKDEKKAEKERKRAEDKERREARKAAEAVVRQEKANEWVAKWRARKAAKSNNPQEAPKSESQPDPDQ